MTTQRKSSTTKSAIQSSIARVLDQVMHDALDKEPFPLQSHRIAKPLYDTIIPSAIFKGSHFERKFEYAFAEALLDAIVTVATRHFGYAERHRQISGVIRQGRLRRIYEVIHRANHSTRDSGSQRRATPWLEQMEYIMRGRGKNLPIGVPCEVYAEDRRSGLKYAFVLETPRFYGDTMSSCKQKILELYAMEPMGVDEAYFVLPYNPFGNREEYGDAFPIAWFDIATDDIVLVGEDFWQMIGGDDAYASFVLAMNELGAIYREKIYRDYLNVTPLADDDATLQIR